jgi:chaperonin cofactor prefoldin
MIMHQHVEDISCSTTDPTLSLSELQKYPVNKLAVLLGRHVVRESDLRAIKNLAQKIDDFEKKIQSTDKYEEKISCQAALVMLKEMLQNLSWDLRIKIQEWIKESK